MTSPGHNPHRPDRLDVDPMEASKTSCQEPVVTIMRARGRSRSSASTRDDWKHDLWAAYLLDGPGRLHPANGPPADIA